MEDGVFWGRTMVGIGLTQECVKVGLGRILAMVMLLSCAPNPGLTCSLGPIDQPKSWHRSENSWHKSLVSDRRNRVVRNRAGK